MLVLCLVALCASDEGSVELGDSAGPGLQAVHATYIQDQQRKLIQLDPVASWKMAQDNVHGNNRDASLRAVQEVVSSVDKLLESSTQVVDNKKAASLDPQSAKEEIQDQLKLSSDLSRDVQQVKDVEALGKAIASAEDTKPTTVIGLSVGQQSDAQMQTLDETVAAMLKDTTQATVDAALAELQKAMRYVATEKLTYEKEVRSKETREKQKENDAAMAEREKADERENKKMDVKMTHHEQKFDQNAGEKKMKEKAKARAAKYAAFKLQSARLANSEMEISVAKGRVYSLTRHAIKGEVSLMTLRDACRAVGERPICNSYRAYDGSCVPIDDGNNDWRLTDDQQFIAHTKLPLSKIRGSYIYTGKQPWAEQSVDSKHALPASNKITTKEWWQDGIKRTYCTSFKETPLPETNFHGMQVVRVPVHGRATSAEILKACELYGKGMMPLCENSGITGGRCTLVRGAAAESLASPQSKAQTQLPEYFRWAVFYAESYPDTDTSSPVINFATGTRRARETDEQIPTVCGRVNPAWQTANSKIQFGDQEMIRVRIPGRANTRSIATACEQQGMTPVCDSFDAYDGSCALLTRTSEFQLSNPVDTKETGLSTEDLIGTYFYTGMHAPGQSAYHGATRVFPSQQGINGETWCVKSKKSVKVDLQQYRLQILKVPGIMTGATASQACKAENMEVVCANEDVFLAEEKFLNCIPFSRWGASGESSMTALSQTSFKGSDIKLPNLRGAMLYNDVQPYTSLQSMGIVTGYKTDKFSDPSVLYYGASTMCGTISSSFMDSNAQLKLGSVTVRRIALAQNKASSNAIFQQCQAKGHLPVCGTTTGDGRCLALYTEPTQDPFYDPFQDVTAGTEWSHKQLGGETNWEKWIPGMSLYIGDTSKGSQAKAVYVKSGGNSQQHPFGFQSLCVSDYVNRSSFQMTSGLEIIPVKVTQADNQQIAKACDALGFAYKPICANPNAALEEREGFARVQETCRCSGKNCTSSRVYSDQDECLNTCKQSSTCRFVNVITEASGDVQCRHVTNRFHCRSGQLYKKTNEPSCNFLYQGATVAVPEREKRADLKNHMRENGMARSPYHTYFFSGASGTPPLYAGTKVLSASGQKNIWTWCSRMKGDIGSPRK